jgi:hypothetical protein
VRDHADLIRLVLRPYGGIHPPGGSIGIQVSVNNSNRSYTVAMVFSNGPLQYLCDRSYVSRLDVYGPQIYAGRYNCRNVLCDVPTSLQVHP